MIVVVEDNGDGELIAVRKGEDGRNVQNNHRGLVGGAIGRIPNPEPEPKLAKKKANRRKVTKKKAKEENKLNLRNNSKNILYASTTPYPSWEMNQLALPSANCCVGMRTKLNVRQVS